MISLLNFDYKLLTKIFANRLKSVIPSIISTSQTGYVQGRNITDTIRLVQDIIHIAEIEQIPGILLMVDFQKAYNSIEWHFIIQALEYFNFGQSLIRWVKIF